jgi:hypothetical protein
MKILVDKFSIEPEDIELRVFMRLTDNWVELTGRFVCKDHDIRGLKDRMSREIIGNLDQVKIGIASSASDTSARLRSEYRRNRRIARARKLYMGALSRLVSRAAA